MKRRIFCTWIAVLLAVCFTVPVFAARNTFFVTDDCGLLTGEQNDQLEQLATRISRQHQFGVYVAVIEDFKPSGYTYLRDYGERLYKDRSYGYGENNSGILLILSMADRDYSMVLPTSEYNAVFTERGLDRLEESVVSRLSRNDYYGAFGTFIQMCDEYLTAYENGSPVGADEGLPVAVAVIPGAIAALIVGLCMAAPMHSAGKKRDADLYVAEGGLKLYRRSDMFLHRSVVRTPRQTQSSSGSSTHHSSGGFSSRSGKF